MSETPSHPTAWQPFTFRGVAAFSTASLSRILVVQLLFACFVAAAVVWFLSSQYGPVMTRAIQHLPENIILEKGQIHHARDGVLAENRFLSIAVDMDQTIGFGQTSDIRIEFHRQNFQVCSLLQSLFGCLVFGYDQSSNVTIARTRMEPWWGAWQPLLWTGAGLITILYLFISWALLAALYAAPARFVAWFADRQLSWVGAWKLSSAALMPGALLMVGGILLYGFEGFDLIGLSFFASIHLLIGWVYLFVSPCFTARLNPATAARNPFQAPPG